MELEGHDITRSDKTLSTDSEVVVTLTSEMQFGAVKAVIVSIVSSTG